MITIEKYTPCRHAQTIELQVLEDQAQFTVENIGKRLESLKPTELPHLILEDDRVVGFFLFDAAYSEDYDCLLYTSPSPRDREKSRMPSSA